MEVTAINCYCIDSELKSGKFDYAYYWTDASENEFKELLDNYLSENRIEDDSKFKAGMFTAYIFQKGYYIHTRRDKVFRPKLQE